nr:hypothetical protein [Sobelivirales sp.]
MVGYILVTQDPAPGMLILPPGTEATITRVISGTNHYYAATVGDITYRILLNWARTANQTGYLVSNTSTTPNPSLIGFLDPSTRRPRPVEQRSSHVSVVQEDGRLVYLAEPLRNATHGAAETTALSGDAIAPVTLDIRVLSRDRTEL